MFSPKEKQKTKKERICEVMDVLDRRNPLTVYTNIKIITMFPTYLSFVQYTLIKPEKKMNEVCNMLQYG